MISNSRNIFFFFRTIEKTDLDFHVILNYSQHIKPFIKNGANNNIGKIPK